MLISVSITRSAGPSNDILNNINYKYVIIERSHAHPSIWYNIVIIIIKKLIRVLKGPNYKITIPLKFYLLSQLFHEDTTQSFPKFS